MFGQRGQQRFASRGLLNFLYWERDSSYSLGCVIKCSLLIWSNSLLPGGEACCQSASASQRTDAQWWRAGSDEIYWGEFVTHFISFQHHGWVLLTVCNVSSGGRNIQYFCSLKGTQQQCRNSLRPVKVFHSSARTSKYTYNTKSNQEYLQCRAGAILLTVLCWVTC